MTDAQLTPAIGVHHEVPFDEYHQWQAASNSGLSVIGRSPAHYKAYREQGRHETPALMMGHAIHTAVLEPDTFDSRYVVAEQCTANTKDGAQCKNMGLTLTSAGWRCGIAAHNKDVPLSLARETKIVIDPFDMMTCRAMRDSVYAHPAARKLLEGITPHMAELSLLWTDPDFGIACKARPDYFSPALVGGTIVDLKSARDASEREFERAIFANGYHRAGAHYLDGAAESNQPAEHFVHIAVEKEAPFAVAVYRLRDDVIVAGRQQLEPLKRRYTECLETNLWPAYSDEVRDIGLPIYAYKQIDDEVFRASV